MDRSKTGRNHDGGRGTLLFLAAAVLLLVVVPPFLALKASIDRSRIAGSVESPGATMVETIIEGCQKSALFIVAALAFLSFRKIVPVVWPLFQASLSGLLIAAEIAAVFWLVYGGLAEIGMPGLFWSPDWWTTLRSAFGVTLFMFWMLYLVFVRDFHVHRHEPEHRVWARFVPVLSQSGLPALLRHKLGQEEGASQIRWFLAYAGLPVLLILAIPALLPAVRPGASVALVEWPWLAGMALGTATIAAIVWARLATRLHELWRQLIRGKIDLRQVRNLDPARLDPHANVKNILVILIMIQIISYLDHYSGNRWMRSLFSPAFSVCVMFGVVATFATYLGTRSRTMRMVIACSLLVLLALTGMLDYEVEIRGLHDWYPEAHEQLIFSLTPEGSAINRGGRVTNLEDFQRATVPDLTSKESHQAREKLLDRWARSFETPGDAQAQARKPILVVVAASGGALRAGLWTETVLGYLDEHLDDFHHNVRLLTGASGGMLGAARYVSGHYEGTGLFSAPSKPVSPPDYLTPLGWQTAFRDFFPNSLFPWATYNRGDALEDAWVEKDRGIALTFEQIKKKEDEGLVPSIVLSPMLVEDGRRLLISNLPLHDLAVIHGEALLSDDVDALGKQYRKENPTIAHTGSPDDYDLEYPLLASVPAVEFFRLFGEKSRSRLTLASAVRMSATFPYITSSVCLPTDPPRHVVDAGYYDNYGVNLAAVWISSHRTWITSHTSGVLVIQTRAFRNEKRVKILSTEIHEVGTDDAPQSVARNFRARVHFVPWLGSLLANGVQSAVMPLEGLAKARDSSMYFRNDEQLRGLKRLFEELTKDEEFFRSVIFTCDTIQFGQRAQNVETLNWYIDPQEFEQIRHNMEPFKEETDMGRDRNDMRFAKLAKWWCNRGGKLKPGAPHGPPGLK